MRADVYLFRSGYANSRESARKAIESGLCSVDGIQVPKASYEIDADSEHEVVFVPAHPYVGRGGLKLEGALKAFPVNPAGLVCVDIGASTGGFTDCLLKNGARKVFAVDSGHGQLAAELLADSRVVPIEGFNAKNLTPGILGEKCGLCVMDVSFISQTAILPVIPALLTDDGCAITLIKPQFEVGRSAVGKGGIVKKSSDRRDACRNVAEAARMSGLYLNGLIKSPVTGGDGNTEFLAFFRRTEGYAVRYYLDRTAF